MREEDLYVDLNTRYSAAFTEINTRITQRQNALIIYVTLILGISTALLATRGDFDTKWLFFFIPLVSLVFAFLNLMHDLMIANLVDFCKLCEKQQNEAQTLTPPQTEILIGYYTHNDSRKRAAGYRRLHDIVALLLILTFNITAYVFAKQFYPDLIQLNSTLFIACLMFFATSIILTVIPTIRRRWKP